MSTIGDKRTTWGLASFLIAALCAFVVRQVWLSGFGVETPELRDRSLVFIASVGAVLAGWFAHASYPRVHNFKVYALSIAIATVSLAAIALVFGLSSVVGPGAADIHSAAIFLGFGTILCVMVLTVVAPEYLRYRSTVRLTGALVFIIAMAFAVGLTVVELRVALAEQLNSLSAGSSTAFWALTILAITVAVLSLFVEAQSFGIGGMHAGGALLLASAWLLPGGDILLYGMVLATLPLLVAVGTLIHWFRRLENRASYDPLLRVYNRGWCDEVLAEQSRLDTRPPFAIALIDLDHFKKINDTHGHDAGDAVLQEIAQRIRSTVVPQGSVARFGGEEIVVFLPETELEQARSLMEIVRRAVGASAVGYRKKKIPVTCSIGLAVRQERGQSLPMVLKAADRAVYAAKDAGRNQVKVGRLRRRSKAN
ncbi:MAG: GGDEF domain-containing protein [Spirochaetales bacterium]|nr:GGDEF domain-containing protein [Spirochaetales bacterium]